jgi:thiamine pyrophosphate-dependent acetolactate synthase large subunit-like protein
VNATGAVRALLGAVPDALAVSSLGTATSALRAASDDGPHFYMGGSMGTALAAAIGVAEKRPERRVLALLGDGETLMGAGSLWSLAGLAPTNLLAVVLADGRYTITGGQPLGVPGRFAEVAAALGLAAAVASSEWDVAAAAAELAWPALLEVRYDDREWPGPSPFVDPPVVRWRFEQAAARDTVGGADGL